MENLRLTFLIFGIVAIIAILIHGLWTIRKNGKGTDKHKFEAHDWKNKSEPLIDGDDEEFDDHGVGSVRVVSVGSRPSLNEIDDSAENDEFEQASDDAQDEKSGDYASDEEDANNSHDSNDETQNGTSENTKNVAINEPITKNTSPDLDDDLSLENTDMDFANLNEEHEQVAAVKLYGSVVTQPKPAFQRSAKGNETSQRQQSNTDSTAIPEPPPFLLKSQAASPLVNPEANKIAEARAKSSSATITEPRGRVEPEFKLDAAQAPVEEAKPISLAAQARKLVTRRKKSVADSIRKEPHLQTDKKLNEEQMRIDFNQEDSAHDESPHANSQAMSAHDNSSVGASNGGGSQTPARENQSSAASNKSPAAEQPTDVLVLNVRAPEGNDITGAALLPMLLTLGLKFGEQDIFHRHVNTNGKGPVLFSLANLFKPGVFDIDNIENFTTRGLSLFMMLPIDGDPQQVFNMMHNAARKLADEFGCQILDGSRGVLTKQGLQKYSERIRDFERKRINR